MKKVDQIDANSRLFGSLFGIIADRILRSNEGGRLRFDGAGVDILGQITLVFKINSRIQ